MKLFNVSLVMVSLFYFVACKNAPTPVVTPTTPVKQVNDNLDLFNPDSIHPVLGKKLGNYVPFTLTTDMSALSDTDKSVLKLLITAAKEMDECFWYEAYGDKNKLLDSIHDPGLKAYILANYGPWDRLDGDKPFIPGTRPKPAGANFYPDDMTKAEFEGAKLDDKKGMYSFVRRNAIGQLYTIPYHEQFKNEHEHAAALLEKAAGLSDSKGFSNYLLLRANALRTDDYKASDFAWLDMKDNKIDIVIGPIETYEDQLFGYRATHEAYVLVKDMEWSTRLAKYAQYLPDLQKNLPVANTYKKDTPGFDTDLNAYDVVFYAGDANAGGKTIAINLPNDEEVQLKKGTRRLQLKNAMKAKFDKILVPITNELIDPSQRKHVTFDAFFATTMFHEVAHGLGIKNTINGSGTVREALLEQHSALEEGKADILGLFMINYLHDRGELEGDMLDYYTTFMASIFRSVRFGASSAHGQANMIRFNFFEKFGAFEKDKTTGFYMVNQGQMAKATEALSDLILTIQGNGDFKAAEKLVKEQGVIALDLQSDLDKLAKKGIPIDVVFRQGIEVLGL
ncbi:MAG: Zn-dependent hydrolase [Saprospiraceae bacterium]